MTIKRCSKGSIPIVKRFLGETFPSPVKNSPQMALIWGNGGLNIRFYDRDPEKAHPCACFGIFCVKIDLGALAVASCKNPKKRKNNSPSKHFWCAVTHARKRNPERIVTNFCTAVGVHEVITSANFYDCSLWGLSVVGGQILGFSINSRRRPYNTLTPRCECVIIITRGQSNLTKSASWGAHSTVRGHPRGWKFVPLNSWGRVSY